MTSAAPRQPPPAPASDALPGADQPASPRTVYGVVPAGGSGVRLWPLSRTGAPKFLHSLTDQGDRSMIQVTVDRFLPLVPIEHILVVTGTLHAEAVADQLPDLPPGNLIAEPAPRESGPAIALAAALIHERDSDAIMVSCHADQVVGDLVSFRSALDTAIEVAAGGMLVTVGVTPDRAETGYGYLRVGDSLGIGQARAVRQFREKPDADTAQSYLASGDFLWNAGMFCWRVDSFLEQLAIELPGLHAGVRALAPRWHSAPPAERDQAWAGLERVSIDHGLMQPAAARAMVATVPAEFGWADVGDWHTLGTLVGADSDGHARLGAGSLLSQDSSDCVVVTGSGRTVALLGVSEMVVVDTPDALLVCPRGRAQEVKGLVERARQAGLDSLL